MDTHDHLLKLFSAYFKENQKWEAQQTHVAGMRARALLAEIRIVARARRDTRNQAQENTNQITKL